MKFLLLLYLTKYHLFSDSNGLEVLGSYAAMVYAMPVIGGLLADRYLGMRKAVVFGGMLLVLGHLGMAFEGEQARYQGEQVVRDEGALQVFYFSLALIVIGVGFLKPNISTIVGQLYHQDDPRRDSGFTIFYMGINIGAFAATLLCGYLGETYGWGYGFGAAGHVAIQIARARGAEVYVCTRDRDKHQALAEELGATWTGGTIDKPPVPLDAGIIFAPAGEIVPPALSHLDKGGTLVLGGIHMVNMKTTLRLCSYIIPDVEILKTIISIPLNRGSDI